MLEESNSTLDKIEKLCKNYEKTASLLSKPVPFITKPFENEENSEISSVFLQAATILRSTIDSSSANSEFSSPEISSLNNQVIELTAQLNNRSETFNKLLKSADQVISNKLLDLEKAYQDKTNQIIAENERRKVEIKEEIQNTQDLFDTKLEEEISPHQKEKTEIQSKLKQLKSDYEKTNQNLITSVRSAKQRIEELEKRKEDFYDDTKVEELRENLNQLELEYQNKIEQKKEEQRKLKEELNSIQSFYSSEEQRLQDLITQNDISIDEKITKSLNAQASSHQQLKSKLENEYKKKELELKRLIDKEEQTNLISVEKMKSDVEEQKRLIQDAQYRYKNALHELESKANAQLEEREQEKRNIEKAHAKTVKQMANQHREQLASIKKESEMARSSLEQKLQKTQTSAQKGQQQGKSSEIKMKNPKSNSNTNVDSNSSKTVFQPSLPAAAPGMKTAPRRLVKKSNPASQNPIQQASIASETSSFNSEYDGEISERMKQFDLAYKMENESFAKAVDSVEERSLLTAEISRLSITRAKRRLERLQNEKELLTDRLKFLVSKSGTILQSEPVAKLQSRISSLYNTIADLKNTNQKLKNERPAKVDLSTIQADHRKELEKMRSRLTTIENANKKRIQQARDSYSKRIQKEIEQRERILADIDQRIEEITEDSRKTKNDISEESLKEHQEWMKMRKELSASNNRIKNSMQSGDNDINRSSGSVQMPPVEPKSFLPLLKH